MFSNWDINFPHIEIKLFLDINTKCEVNVSACELEPYAKTMHQQCEKTCGYVTFLFAHF
jgi:hypothetical protein